MPKLTPDALAQLPSWKARKQAQWERVAGTLPGLQLVKYGDHQSTVMLVYSADDFYEGVIFGRLPKQWTKPKRGPRPAETVIVEKLIDLSDDQIDSILLRWMRGQSALDLDFVEAVWGRDGKPKAR